MHSECKGIWTCIRQLASLQHFKQESSHMHLTVEGFLGLQWVGEGDCSHQQGTI